ncbi:hypothetical protein [Stenotrophomonas indicatrix]|uniref:hypothetical protein n=1 Tax=Stenotrophomonas indicatrix TaxID=2045451 RepID=UPI001CBAB66E|nr:hypothetical protein [Stenotrophomonas indicatrix]
MDVWTLIDMDGLRIGTVQRFSYRDCRVSGRFVPDVAFSRHQKMFADLEDAADAQLFFHVDDLERSIAALRIRAVPPEGKDVPQLISDLQIMRDWCQFRINSMTGPAEGHPFSLTPAERDTIRALIAFVRAGCPDGPSPAGFPIGRNEDFRRKALEFFSDPPDPANHFRIDVPSDEYVALNAVIYGPSSDWRIELDLFADGEQCDLTATFDLDRQSTVDSGPRLYDMHVM